ncbi:MAG: serine--tRNA ligase [Chloroflexota bacterium]|nr:serine--tRNA ligase [Chloroflexota bacterium]
MLDIKRFRDNPAEIRDSLQKRGESTEVVEEVLRRDAELRQIKANTEQVNATINKLSKQVRDTKEAAAKQELIAKSRAMGEEIKQAEADRSRLENELYQLMLTIPNVPHSSVPVGKDENENVEVRRWSEPKHFDFEPKPHWEIGENLGIVDFERGVKVFGNRGYALVGQGARLERALFNWMLDVHVSDHGYTEIYPPYLVKREAALGTGQLPKFAEEMYYDPIQEVYLNPTAEVPVTNLHAQEILEPGVLPIKYCAFTTCFRTETGSGGRDKRGVVRVHQFNKVEMVKFVEPSTSYAELESLVSNAEDILQRLGLPYRVLKMCTGDVGFTAAMKFDPEVWMAGQNKYVEISSCSNFEDFQARRANIRYRPALDAKPEFVHTLNGSGLAVGRTWAAILENYQQADGSVIVPEVLRPYMGGLEIITGK